MGMEIPGTEFVQVEGNDETPSNISNSKPSQEMDVPSEPIKFGAVDSSHSMKNGLSKGGADPVVNSNFPKDAVDEWPEPKQIHSFFFVRFRPFEDPKLKAKIDQADKEIQKKNQARFQVTDALKAKRSDRAAVISQLKPLTAEDKRYRMMLDEKRKELEPLQAALGKLRSAGNTGREKGVGLCSSEEDLNDLIASLHYRIQHESNTLAEEKQLLKEIKQLEGTREKVIANDNMKARIQDSLGQKEAIQDQVKHIGGDLDGVRKEQHEVRKKIKLLEEELSAIDGEISSLQEELVALNQKRDKAYESFVELRKAREEGNVHFYQNRALLNNAKELAAKKDIAALQELSFTEMEKFMALWSSTKAFRDDYEKRILSSLDMRQLSRDGRIRNPDEKPLVSEVVPAAAEPAVAPVKVNAKRAKEDAKVVVEQPNSASHNKLQNEVHRKSIQVNAKGMADPSVEVTVESFSLPEKSQKESPAADMMDEVKLKEMKRDEEMAKAKLAFERKKKMAEKAAAKAAIRAQKEAEKKLKEREKRAKKKAGASTVAESEPAAEAETTGEELEKTEAHAEAPFPVKTKEQKENVRQRNRLKAHDPPVKSFMKKKKSQNYWVWAIPAAVMALLLAIFAYYYV